MSEYEVTTRTYGTGMETIDFEKTDESMPYRFVGSYEYAKAVETFETLVSMSTAEELEAYDKVLNGRPEFTYFNGANVMLAAPLNLQNANKNQRVQFFDTFRKKGLAWMMALAKVELSATASMYGDSKKPFQTIRVTNYDMAPYMQVLADDAAAHLRSLSQEQGFLDVTRSARTVDTWTLAYLRRLKLIRDMLSTLGTIGDSDMKARIKPYDAKLKVYERKLLSAVDRQTGTRTFDLAGENTEMKTGKTKMHRITGQTLQDCKSAVQKFGERSGGSSKIARGD